jgi:hypothetical protein
LPPDEKAATNQQVARDSSGTASTAVAEKELDSAGLILHNLISLLHTNTTLRTAGRQYRIPFFKN